MPSFTKLLIMKYTPLVSTEKEFELWFDPLMVLSTLSASKAVLSCGIITFCDKLYFFAKKCFSGIASWLSDNFFVVPCCLNIIYCTLLVTIIIVNTMIVDMHANICDKNKLVAI